MIVVWVIVTYLATGMAFLVLYDSITHRIRNKFSAIALDNQIQTMGIAQMPVSLRTVRILTFLGLLTQWPLLIPSLFRKKGDKNAAK